MDGTLTGLFVCLGAGIAICLLIGVVLVLPLGLVAGKSCAAKAERLGVEYDYGIMQGCFVKQGNTWVDYSNYRVILSGEK